MDSGKTPVRHGPPGSEGKPVTGTEKSVEEIAYDLSITDTSVDRIGRQAEVPSFFADAMDCPIDLTEDVLRHCGGRLTIHDARLLYSSSMHLKAKTILEVGSFDG